MRIIVWELNCGVLGRWIEYVVLCIVKDRMGVIIIKLIINRDLNSIRKNVICYDNGVIIDVCWVYWWYVNVYLYLN